MHFSKSEMIAAIYEAKASGTFGTFSGFGQEGGAMITLDEGKPEKYSIWVDRSNFHVYDHNTGIEGIGSTVENAAWMAVNP